METRLRTGGHQVGRQRRCPKRRDPLLEGPAKNAGLRRVLCDHGSRDSTDFRNVVNDFSRP
jgi:hypothetical protein